MKRTFVDTSQNQTSCSYTLSLWLRAFLLLSIYLFILRAVEIVVFRDWKKILRVQICRFRINTCLSELSSILYQCIAGIDISTARTHGIWYTRNIHGYCRLSPTVTLIKTTFLAPWAPNYDMKKKYFHYKSG